jgi:hypothetical protein
MECSPALPTEGSAVPSVRRRWLLTVALLTPGCLAARPATALPPVVRAAHAPPACPEGLVLIVDGAGGFQATSRSFRRTAEEARLPVEIETFRWTHGYLRVLADHLDTAHAREQGHRLAGHILASQQERPGLPIFVVAHSAGCAVALAAVEVLPPNTLERIVLLSPAVSESCDLRPALACARCGVDVFYSRRDWGYLGVGVALFGTADHCWQAAAGRVGFAVEPDADTTVSLYARLRQYPWEPCVAWTGNAGGHYGVYRPSFLRYYIFPLLTPCTACLSCSLPDGIGWGPRAGVPAAQAGPASDAATNGLVAAGSSPVISRAERLRVK